MVATSAASGTIVNFFTHWFCCSRSFFIIFIIIIIMIFLCLLLVAWQMSSHNNNAARGVPAPDVCCCMPPPLLLDILADIIVLACLTALPTSFLSFPLLSLPFLFYSFLSSPCHVAQSISLHFPFIWRFICLAASTTKSGRWFGLFIYMLDIYYLFICYLYIYSYMYIYFCCYTFHLISSTCLPVV